MKYEDFWKTQGLKYITPKDLKNPEGFSVGDILKTLIPAEHTVLEIGCGTGRLCQIFRDDKYIGIDINPSAIHEASAKNPGYNFAVIKLGQYLMPPRDSVLLYTVCLHIPNEILRDQLKIICSSSKKSVIIAEIMNPKYRSNRVEGAEYDISNQRSATDYIDLMGQLGFDLETEMKIPYAYYKGEDITFLKFTRR